MNLRGPRTPRSGPRAPRFCALVALESATTISSHFAAIAVVPTRVPIGFCKRSRRLLHLEHERSPFPTAFLSDSETPSSLRDIKF